MKVLSGSRLAAAHPVRGRPLRAENRGKAKQEVGFLLKGSVFFDTRELYEALRKGVGGPGTLVSDLTYDNVLYYK
jgi:hypothetical protein